jgi:pimeloyl-ACP methyl ester carboxylesterase
MVSQELEQRLRVDGAVQEYELLGAPAGEPVVLIHGSFIAEAFAHYAPSRRSRPATGWCATTGAATPAARGHRRRPAAPGRPSRPPTAGPCCGGWASRAHVVGHSGGGRIALRLALDAPEVVHSLALLEPALLDVPSGPAFAAAVGPARQRYQAGDLAGATDGFLRVAIGPAYRSVLDARPPGAYAQAVADADAHFAGQAPAAGAWRLSREEARRIDQPVLAVLGGESAEDWAGWPEVQARLQEWLPQAEAVVLPGANHALPWQDPRGVAEALAAFFARRPLPARA